MDWRGRQGRAMDQEGWRRQLGRIGTRRDRLPYRRCGGRRSEKGCDEGGRPACGGPGRTPRRRAGIARATLLPGGLVTKLLLPASVGDKTGPGANGTPRQQAESRASDWVGGGPGTTLGGARRTGSWCDSSAGLCWISEGADESLWRWTWAGSPSADGNYGTTRRPRASVEMVPARRRGREQGFWALPLPWRRLGRRMRTAEPPADTVDFGG